MPRIHLGVYMTSGQETNNAVHYALAVLPTQHASKGRSSADDADIRLATERTLPLEGQRD